MKKILYSFLLFSSVTLFAQQKNPAVKFAVADNAIGTVELFNTTTIKNLMQVSKVYNNPASFPQSLQKYSSVFTKGITEYKFKNGQNPFDKMALSEINVQYNIPADNPVFIEGYEFTDTSALIYPQIRKKMEVKDYNGKKTLFIYTTE
ncbi:Uncharacterised protein [Chryseobacterium gleum]|uniref:GLPGLI family protein n=2 Tax=Chryseobacterium gleum TaxID=250 RepID=A0A3S5E3G5_CHRGE|nr:hypothetical protein [Chryseobacterium gleum]EFK35415.1 hypothetical protein HMPREF0204_14484 [Chryseobacterium gleum ATCC 35910]MCD9619161.1 hypothetical protein [Chryseobacterium gleum]QQY31187.1 hypothetical protein I6I60_20315 [Chryseobacterium gleum]VEE12466.1 Uncharacterised protein [Chryseobacterium gleum]